MASQGFDDDLDAVATALAMARNRSIVVAQEQAFRQPPALGPGLS